MEHVFSLHDGRNALLFDEGNDVILAICGPGRNVKFSKIINDYHSSLIAVERENDIFFAYISYAREIVVNSVMGENRIVLFQDSSDALNIRNLSFAKFQGKLYLLCLMDLNENETVIRSYELDGERKKKDIIRGRHINQYYVVKINNHNILWFEEERGLGKYYDILLNYDGDLMLNELIIDTKENITNVTEMSKIKEKECEIRLEKFKEEYLKEYEGKLEKELEKQRESFKNKYNKLVETTKEIQQEGKKWRQLYYENVNI